MNAYLLSLAPMGVSLIVFALSSPAIVLLLDKAPARIFLLKHLRFIVFASASILSLISGLVVVGLLMYLYPTVTVQRIEQAAEPLPAVVEAATSTPAYDATLLKLYLVRCNEAMQRAIPSRSLRDIDGVFTCAENLRMIDAPSDYGLLALADQFEAYAIDNRAGLQEVDASRIEAARERVKPIYDAINAILNKMPAD